MSVGDENSGSKVPKSDSARDNCKTSSTKSKTDYSDDSSDSVTFVMESSPAPSASQTTKRGTNRNSSESDDVIEIDPRPLKSRSGSPSRSR